jgi:hypothetical protein
MLNLRPVTQREAFAFIDRFHRHHPSPTGWKCGVGVERATGELCGVITLGRPKSRVLQRDPYLIEVTRCCTDGTPNAASMLYGAAKRAAKALGYRRLITYTLQSEPGSSLRAVGFAIDKAHIRGRSWSCQSRPRTDRHALEHKTRWGVTL